MRQAMLRIDAEKTPKSQSIIIGDLPMIDNLLLLFQFPTLLLETVLDGLLFGGMIAIVAYGLALVWGVMNVINVAQGDFVILGGLVAVSVVQQGFNALWGVPVAAVVLAVLGLVVYKSFLWRLIEKDLFYSLLATFGLSIVLQQLMNLIFGADVQVAQTNLPNLVIGENTFDLPITITGVRVLAFCMSLLVGGTLIVFLKRSRLGQSIRATAQNQRAARVVGINTDRVYAATFALNAALCGAAGALVAMVLSVHPYGGLSYSVRSFMIVITAGLGNLPGVLLAAFGLSSAEYLAAFILGAEFQIGFTFSLLVVILLVRNHLLKKKRLYLK